MSLDVNISEPEEFNSVELHGCLEEVARIYNFNDFKYHVDLISGKGENYIANVFRVVIEDTDSGKYVNVIVKTLINTTRRELFSDIHKREVMVYRDVLSKFREILSQVNESQKFWFPECLYTNTERNKEVIILKDLKESGFEITDIISKYDVLSYEKVKLVLTGLAKFHGLSFVHERLEEENFNELKEKFGDILFQEKFLSKSKLRNYFFESYDMSLKLVENVEVKKKLEKVRNKLLEILRLYTRPAKHNVLCHGDLWSPNILFKQEGEENETCFLDYQAMRYCCPVIDIIYFMYLSTNSQFRSDHFDDLLEVYHEALNSFLKLYDIDINTVYPKKDFLDELQENLPFGLVIGLVEMRIVTTSLEEEVVLKSKTVTGFDITEIPGEIDLFRHRVNDVVEESVNNGVLERLLKTIEILYSQIKYV